MAMFMHVNDGLGLIPSWQFSMDPAINYKINPHVQFPDGIYQTTPQPLYPYYQGPELSGLRDDSTSMFDSWAWNNKKWLILGGVALFGLALVGGASAILK